MGLKLGFQPCSFPLKALAGRPTMREVASLRVVDSQFPVVLRQKSAAGTCFDFSSSLLEPPVRPLSPFYALSYLLLLLRQTLHRPPTSSLVTRISNPVCSVISLLSCSNKGLLNSST